MQKSLSAEDPTGILQKIEYYCAYRERCSREVLQKLGELKVPASKNAAIIQHLQEQGFLDNARFARSFAAGHFRTHKWGRVKIRFELKRLDIPEELVQTALESISEEEYLSVIRDLVLKKKQEIKTGKNLIVREKIINFVAGKGFEFNLIAGILKELKI